MNKDTSFRFALVLTMLFFSLQMNAISYIFKGNGRLLSDIMYTWDGKHLYYGMGTNEMDMFCTFNGKELYCDNHSITPNNVIITWDGHNIYRGKSTDEKDILYYWSDSTLWWKANGEAVMTYYAPEVYKPNDKIIGHNIYTVSGDIPIPVLAFIM